VRRFGGGGAMLRVRLGRSVVTAGRVKSGGVTLACGATLTGRGGVTGTRVGGRAEEMSGLAA